MTKTEAIRRIKSLTYMTAKATFNGAEIRITYHRNAGITPAAQEAAAYYTDCPKDALATAMRMCLAKAHEQVALATEVRNDDLSPRKEQRHAYAAKMIARAEEAGETVKAMAADALTEIGAQGATILHFPSKKNAG
jgi:hypothetical protein